MIVKTHVVENYRNIEKIEIKPADTITVISGENGQGKTNLLESIWLLSGSKSFRSSKDNELVQKGKEIAFIKADINTRKKENLIKVVIGSENSSKKGRFASVNEVDYGRATNLAGIFYCVVFAPGHLSIIKGAPAGRRKFIDAALCQLYPRYIDMYRRYTRLSQQRNAVLKDMRRGNVKGGHDLLDVLDQDLGRYGADIVKRRIQYIEKIKDSVTEKYQKISRNKEQFMMKYQYKTQDAQEMTSFLRESRATDIKLGFSLVGPHRDDLEFSLDGEDAKIFASQGQQRSIALCLKLAEAEEILNVTEEMPVILLDDVLSELDSHRQSYLLNHLIDRQVFITSCEADFFTKYDGILYTIENGAVK